MNASGSEQLRFNSQDANADLPSLDPSSDIASLPMGVDDEGSVITDLEKISSIITPPLQGLADVGCRKRVISSRDLLEQCKASLEQIGSELWGLHIRRSAVTMIVGETSAGKTTFLHNLAYHLAEGKEFLQITPAHAVRVLYVDFESDHDILEQHLSVIGTANGWDFYTPDEGERGTVLLPNVERVVKDGGYEVVIIDPLMEAWPVLRENDNSEANVQMLQFRGLARRTEAGVVVVHNSGNKKENPNAKFLGRGATTRSDRAEVVMNLTSLDDTTRQLHVAKSRGKNLNERVTFKFATDLGYEVVACTPPAPTMMSQLQAEIVRIVIAETAQGRPDVERATLVSLLNFRGDGAKEQALDRALIANVARGLLVKPRKGVYRLATAQEAEIAAIE